MSQLKYKIAKKKCLQAESFLKIAKRRDNDKERILKAIALYTEVLGMGLSLTDPYIGIAYLALSNGDKAKAVGLLLTAKEIDPTDMRVDILMEKIEDLNKNHFPTSSSSASIPSSVPRESHRNLKTLRTEKSLGSAEKDRYFEERLARQNQTRQLNVQAASPITAPSVAVSETLDSDLIQVPSEKSLKSKKGLMLLGQSFSRQAPGTELQIMLLKSALAELGFDLVSDIDFGLRTYQALKQFQSKVKLPVTGAVDLKTRGKLNAVLMKLGLKQYRGELEQAILDCQTNLHIEDEPAFPTWLDSLWQLGCQSLQGSALKKKRALAQKSVRFEIGDIKPLEKVSEWSSKQTVNLQILLSSLGYGLKASAQYDALTIKVIRSYQAHMDLPLSGNIDTQTLNQLNTHLLQLPQQKKLEEILLGQFESWFPEWEQAVVCHDVLQNIRFLTCWVMGFVSSKKMFASHFQVQTNLGPKNHSGKIYEGHEVYLLQWALAHLGFDVKPSRQYDPPTYHAVRKFQMKSKLPMTGILDPKTRFQINVVLKRFFPG